MSPSSLRALFGLSTFLFLAGVLVASPAAAVVALGLAAACVLPPLARGSRRQRIGAAVLVLLSLWLAAVQWPAMRREGAAWRQHAQQAQAVPPSPEPVPPPPGSPALPSTAPDAQPDVPVPAAPRPVPQREAP